MIPFFIGIAVICYIAQWFLLGMDMEALKIETKTRYLLWALCPYWALVELLIKIVKTYKSLN